MDQTSDFPDRPITIISDNGSSLATAVCLPFSLVPGMDTSSNAYQRALVALSKQEVTPLSRKVGPSRALIDRGTLEFLFPIRPNLIFLVLFSSDFLQPGSGE